VRDQVSHPYKTTGTIIHVLFFIFLDIYRKSTGHYNMSCRTGGLKSLLLEQQRLSMNNLA
jgi:hypothetical protein